LDEARSRGDLATNSFVTLKKAIDADGKRRIAIANLGHAEAIF
jgi:hypothetical protein